MINFYRNFIDLIYEAINYMISLFFQILLNTKDQELTIIQNIFYNVILVEIVDTNIIIINKGINVDCLNILILKLDFLLFSN